MKVKTKVLNFSFESGIYNGPGFEPASGHLVLCVLSASETGLLLVVKLGRNVVMMREVVKIMRDAVKLPIKKKKKLLI